MAERAIVMDNGAAVIKVGLAGAKEPHCFPNLVCKDRRTKQCYISSQVDDALDCSSLSYRRPFEKGYFVDSSTQADIWKYVFGVGMKMTAEDLRSSSLLLTAPYFTPKKLQREYNELAFELFEFKDFACTSSAFLALVAHFACGQHVPSTCWPFAPAALPQGRQKRRWDGTSPPTELAKWGGGSPQHPCTGVVVESGYSFSHVVPFVGGRAVKSAIRRVPVGSKVLINNMKSLLSFRQYDMTEEDCLVSQLVEQLCFVSTDFECDMRMSAGPVARNPIRTRYLLPSGHPGTPSLGQVVAEGMSLSPTDQVLVLNNERFTIPELLFHPSDVGFSSMGIAEAVVSSLQSPDIDPNVVPLLLENVVLSGGCSDLPGFEQRMQQELAELVNTELINARCHHLNRGRHSAFYGGCEVITSDFYQTLAVSRKEYQEQGGESVCRSRFWADFL
eukprot:GGOE01036642.1.p1 GENE.GGOE01036642.1~~GGOE01036642.1.p1  ORF type:complete len:446 (+),score=92.90 GGOE01036642.1:68-1405(+)